MGDVDEGRRSVRRTYDWTSTTPSIAVIDAIAILENVKPVDLPVALDTRLFDHVDPEALDAIVTDAGGVSVSFPVDGYRVRIDEDELLVRNG